MEAGLITGCMARTVMPCAFSWAIVIVTVNRAYFWSPPSHTDASLIAGLCICSHSCAEALTVATIITGTGVFHTVVKVGSRVHLCVAEFEGLSFDDAALNLCPGVTIEIFKAGIKVFFCIWTGTDHFPAVGKLQDITDEQLVLSGKIILAVPIEVATKTTHLTHVFWLQNNANCCFFVPVCSYTDG